MPRPNALLRLPLPSVLLLGLLALLLWGACNNSNDAPDCCGERVVRVDSLAAPFPGAPPRLYLTIGLRNDDADQAKVESMYGILIFRGQFWNDLNEGQRQYLTIPPKRERLVSMALPLTDSLACDPALLRPLQQALAKGTAGDSTLVLQLGVNVELRTENGYLQDSGQEFPLPAMRAPARPAQAAAAY
ncbi:hypothetical protein ACFST9_18785 [Hymenobacter monticola]|uniref:Late embryogenesis abundant protein LEA-2 subgroup domain-containing protein n=1 Tax=Hymenobacter monticola TaxID=1705399 RepID=A0ABY4AYT0_9BACT|nr:hypothetical protein [Hymenobacter monticola]UOE32047.1 hypothetical protein MTP16_12980 [Hymenobacter monticola]